MERENGTFTVEKPGKQSHSLTPSPPEKNKNF